MISSLGTILRRVATNERSDASRRIHACSGFAFVGLIAAILIMSLLTAGMLALFNIGMLQTAEQTSASSAFFAAETGISIGKAFCRTNAAWTSQTPATITGPVGRGQYSVLVDFSTVVTQISTQTIWIGLEPLPWSSTVSDGYRTVANKQLSAVASLIDNIRDDDGDALDFDNYAHRGATIGDHQWYSVYFTNDFPTNATNVITAKVYIDYQGPAGVTGMFEVAVSTNKSGSLWYQGNDGAADVTSGGQPWDGDVGEQRYEYDLTAVLDTADKMNDFEILILNYNDSAKSAGKGRLNFDFISVDAEYLIPPTQLTMVTTSVFPQALIVSTGTVGAAKWSSAWAGGGAATWSSVVTDGYCCQQGGRALSSRASLINNIRDDDGDALDFGNVAGQGDAITDHAWYSVYFNDDLSTEAVKINSAKVYIDHQGKAGNNGLLAVHVSTNRMVSRWYLGIDGTSDTNSADVAWNDVEQRYEYDVTSILDTPDKVRNCEILIINRDGFDRDVNFDYIYFEVDYY